MRLDGHGISNRKSQVSNQSDMQSKQELLKQYNNMRNSDVKNAQYLQALGAPFKSSLDQNDLSLASSTDG